MARTHPMLVPFKDSPETRWDEVKAAHLLNRAGFGGTPEEVQDVLAMGPEKAVDALMDFPDAPMDEQSQTGGPDFSKLKDYPKSFQELRAMMVGKTEQERKEIRQKFQAANREAVTEVALWWLRRMANGPFPLQEKLTFMWHGHFTTSSKDERSALLMWNQNEILRRFCTGNFKQFVRTISRDPAMLDYLNNSQNRKAHPNENYARELMELFTLGIGNYTENDIKESARAFTGWAHDGDEYIFRRGDHDDGPKTFMGRTGNFGGDEIIDIILQNKACAPYIAGRFVKYFAYEPDAADQDMLATLGETLVQANWDMRPMLRQLLLSKAFYSEKAIGTQIKSPVQLVVQAVRQLGMAFPAPRVILGSLKQMGQVPLDPPNVKGWPGGRLWVNTSTLFVRYNTMSWLAGGELPALGARSAKRGVETGVSSALAARLANGNGPSYSVTKTDGTPEEIVNYWVGRLIQRPIERDKRLELTAIVAQDPTSIANLKRLIQLIVVMPDYQLC